MANASVTQLITPQSIGWAINEARKECRDSHRWLNAVNRGAVELVASHWQFDGETLRIESATTLGVKYTVDAYGCDCKAGKSDRPCKHRAAWRLLCKAAEMAQRPTPRMSHGEYQAMVSDTNEYLGL